MLGAAQQEKYHLQYRLRTNYVKLGEEVIVDIGTGFKLLAFMFWPVLLMFIAFLLDRKRFKKRWEKFKQEGFFKSK
jgi:hypothetical protein